MQTVPLQESRWRRDGQRYRIPNLKDFQTFATGLMFLGVFGYAPAFSLVTALRAGDWAEHSAILTIVGVASVAGTLAGLYILVFAAVGAEVIEISSGELAVGTELFGFWKPIRYRLADVRELRSVPQSPKGSRQPGFRRRMSGAIAFDYGAQTVYLGLALSEADAKLLVREILTKYPSLAKEVGT